MLSRKGGATSYFVSEEEGCGFHDAGWKSLPVLVGSSLLSPSSPYEGAEAWPVGLVR